MKKLLACAALVAATIVPATAAHAAPVRVSQCATGDVGIIVWTTDPTTGNEIELVHACVLIVQ